MVSKEELAYIRKELADGFNKEAVVGALIKSGWKLEDIAEGFAAIEKETNAQVVLPANQTSPVQPTQQLPQTPLKKTEAPQVDTATTSPYTPLEILVSIVAVLLVVGAVSTAFFYRQEILNIFMPTASLDQEIQPVQQPTEASTTSAAKIAN